jgi:hypothetical protein
MEEPTMRSRLLPGQERRTSMQLLINCIFTLGLQSLRFRGRQGACW